MAHVGAGAGNAIVVISMWALCGSVLGLSTAGPLRAVLCVECVVAYHVNVMLVLKLRAWRTLNRWFLFTVTPASVCKP
jgi:hypothetical protein